MVRQQVKHAFNKQAGDEVGQLAIKVSQGASPLGLQFAPNPPCENVQ